VALSAVVREEIFLSSLSVLARPNPPASTLRAAQQIIRQYNLDPTTLGYTSLLGLQNAVWTVVKQAAAAHAAAELLQPGNPTAPVPPRIPGIESVQPEYLYRAVVSVTDASGHRHTTAIDVRSDTPLSHDTVANDAIEQVLNSTPNSSGTPGRERVRGLIPVATVDVVIIAAGRR
jgi:hypothetical protein